MLTKIIDLALKLKEILPKMTREQQKQFFLWLPVVLLIFMMGKTIYEQNKLIQAYENAMITLKRNIDDNNKQMDYKLLQISDEINVMRIIMEMKDPNITKEIDKYYAERRENRK